jgi:hypothetical protein
MRATRRAHFICLNFIIPTILCKCYDYETDRHIHTLFSSPFPCNFRHLVVVIFTSQESVIYKPDISILAIQRLMKQKMELWTSNFAKWFLKQIAASWRLLTCWLVTGTLFFWTAAPCSPSASFYILAWLNPRSWRLRQYIPPKHWCTTRPHGVTTHNIVTAVRS